MVILSRLDKLVLLSLYVCVRENRTDTGFIR